MDQIIIIGNPNRRVQDEPLIKKSEELFSKAFYVPITEIRIKSNGRIYHGKTDISSSQLLPIPYQYSDMFLAILSSIHGYIPYRREALLMTQKKLLGLAKLRQAGFLTLNTFSLINELTVDSITSKISFPVDLTIGEISARVTDERHLKDMVRLRRPGQAVTIKEPIEYPLTGCFVVNDEVIAVRIENDKEKLKSINIGSRLTNLVTGAVAKLNSNYGFVCLSNEKIISMSLSPNFAAIERATNKDVAAPLIRHMKDMIPSEREKTVLGKIIDAFKARK